MALPTYSFFFKKKNWFRLSETHLVLQTQARAIEVLERAEKQSNNVKKNIYETKQACFD
jgi:hypothetical protein